MGPLKNVRAGVYCITSSTLRFFGVDVYFHSTIFIDDFLEMPFNFRPSVIGLQAVAHGLRFCRWYFGEILPFLRWIDVKFPFSDFHRRFWEIPINFLVAAATPPLLRRHGWWGFFFWSLPLSGGSPASTRGSTRGSAFFRSSSFAAWSGFTLSSGDKQ